MKSDLNPADFLILICDDEDSIRSMLGEAVKGWGFQVVTAASGEEGLDFVKNKRLPNVILTDIRMGGMTGLELAAEARKISDEIEVIIMTSHGSFETAVQAVKIGVHDYLSKPFENIADVKNTLLHVCDRIWLRMYTEFLYEETERKTEEVSKFAALLEELSTTLDVQKVLTLATRGLSRAFDNAPVIFFQFLPSQKSLAASVRSHDSLFGATQPRFALPEGIMEQPSEWPAYFQSLKHDVALSGVLNQADELSPAELRAQGWTVAPVVTHNIPRGIMAIAKAFEDQDTLLLLDRYVSMIGTNLDNALMHAKITEVSIRDGLTGVFNVRHFKTRLDEEISKSNRLKHPLSVIFFDVDHFKKVNDTHGHPVGDQVLRMMAEVLKKTFRSTDIIGRYGGEEFVVAMPHTPFADALRKAEAFRELVTKTEFPFRETQPLGFLSVSVGVAEFPTHGSKMDVVLKAADDAVYEVKKSTRNRVQGAKVPDGYVAPFQPVETKPTETKNQS